MDRRIFIQTVAGSIATVMTPNLLRGATCSSKIYAGWYPNRSESKRYIQRTKRPYFVERAGTSVIGNSKGRTALLYKYLEKALGGAIVPHDQELGDCVGQGYGFGTDTLSATQIFGAGRPEQFIGKTSTESVYAGSRFEIGYKIYGNARLLKHDGSFGAYAAEFVREFGTLVRKPYGEIDLTNYRPDLAKLWGKEGVPDNLEPLIRKHPVRTTGLVRNYQEARDALSNGYPIVICSGVGFNPQCRKCNPGGRDSLGFLNPCGTWYHCMVLIAVDDTDRPGCLCMNSWGPDWVGGGSRLGQPAGSFWIDAKTVTKILSDGDSFALSGYIGFPSQDLDYILF